MGKIIGIDLGTTNSVVSVVEGGAPTVIQNKQGEKTTPSTVAYTKDGERLVGTLAKRQAVTNPERTISSIKRFIGRKYDEITDEMKNVPYHIIKRENGDVAVKIDDKELTPQDISAAILGDLKQSAEEYLGQQVSEAVITVPAYFNDAQRQATKDAGKIAGLEVKRIINEPTAAALAYGVNKKQEGKVIVFDFGGGTFDVSVLDISDGVIEVKATNGDSHLGGDDIDQKLIDYMVEQFKQEQGVDLSQDRMALQRLKEAAEKAKVELSSAQETEINLPYITADQTGPKHLVMKITRSKLESLCSDIFERLLKPCKQAMSDANLEKNDIDEVIMVGGSTRIPKVQELVTEYFGKQPNKSVNPDEVVAVGAAIQGSILTGESTDVLLLDVTPLSLGIETLGGVTTTLIERNTTIPTKKSQVFSTAEDNQTAVDIKVVQGEREMAKDNDLLGQFRLEGIPAAPRGVPQIEVTFDIDANGIVHVSAKDKGTGKEQKITITASGGLSQEEIDKKVKEAQEHAEEDKQKREAIEKRNRLDSAIFEVEKTLKENRDKIEQQEIDNVESQIESAKQTLKEKEDDAQALEQAYNDLMQSTHKIAELLYKQQQADSGEQQQQESSEESSGHDNSHDDSTINTDAEDKSDDSNDAS